MLANRLVLSSLLATSVSAAYVQNQLCEQGPSGTPPPGDHPHVSSLSASIETAHDGHQRLTWVLDLLVGDEGHCHRQVQNVTAVYTVETLTGTAHYEQGILTTCKPVHISRDKFANALSALIAQDVGPLGPLSTFHSKIRLTYAAAGDDLTCVEANITPELRPAASLTLRWAPFCLFLFVLFVGILRSCFDRPIRLADDDAPVEQAHSIRTVLPHVGDCLQYLQFIFLTGSLSLRYPGFYQPAVSKLNWFSLFLRGPITHGRVYPSSRDGIYEINGTYGGTHGFEIMHQIVGAPPTMATWTNLVIAMAIIVVFAALLLECLRLGAPQADEAGMTGQTAVLNRGLQYRANRVLRIILSYFTMPLIALSFYQTAYAAILPRYHTSLAVLLIAIIVAAFVWLLRQTPMRSLGLLVFDAKRYQRISTSTSSDQHGKAFILILFVLSFIRGTAIGGLQIAPPAQLPVLGACELVLLACNFGFQAYPALSVGTVSAISRLVTLGLMATFLPGVADTHVKSAVGYAILLIHGSMLFCGFLGPAVYHLVVLCARYLHAPKPDVYGLRQLRRREASRTDRNGVSIDLLNLASPSPDIGGRGTPLSPRPYSRPDSISTLHPETPHIPASRYFRPPRPASVRSKGSVDLRSKTGSTSQTRSSISSRGPSRAVSPLVNTSATFGAILERKHEYDIVSALRTSESSSSAPSSSDDAPSSSSDNEGRPLGPRWNDYSFRESDLFYMVPQPGAPQAAVAMEHAPEPAATRPTIRSVSSSLWTKVRGQDAAPAAQERGFQVVRPSNGLQPPPGPLR